MRHLCILIPFLILSCNNREVSEHQDNTSKSEEEAVKQRVDNFIGSTSLDSLKHMGFIVDTLGHRVNTLVTKHFRGKRISVKICTNFADADFGVIDSIMIYFDDKTQNINLIDDSAFISHIDPERGLQQLDTYIELADYNFDNEPDIAIYNGASGVSNTFQHIFLYSLEEQQFKLHEQLSSEFSNCHVDTLNHFVYSWSNGGFAGLIHTWKKYRWKENELIAIESESQRYDDELDRFIRATKRLVGNKWVVKLDTLTEDQLDNER